MGLPYPRNNVFIQIPAIEEQYQGLYPSCKDEPRFDL